MASCSRLEQLGIRFPFFVAPMVGISHVAFRELVRSYAPGLPLLLYTEMLSTRRLPHEKLESAEYLRFAPSESGLIPQLLGNEEEPIAASMRKLSVLRPWGFDINMGCPVSHTLKHNWGVRLMGDPAYAGQVVRATKKHSNVPVSVKMRAGAGDGCPLDYLLQFTKELEDSGADWITIHGRPQNRGHRGPANLELVGEVALRRKIPTVVNGGIQTAVDALAALRDYPVDGIMIGRAAIARPWILGQIANSFLGTQLQVPDSAEAEGREYFLSLVKFTHLLDTYYGDSESSLEKLEYFVRLGHPWMPFGHDFWAKLKQCPNLASSREFITAYGTAHPQSMQQTTLH